VSTPAQDQNIQTPAAQATGTANPPIPADHAQQTPEFLQKLIRELNDLRNQQAELYAKMYPAPSPLGGRPKKSYKPPYEVQEEYRRQDMEFDKKISALKGQIQELRTLLARTVQPEPELGKMPGPTQPPSPEPAEAPRGA
jgi:DNA repair exonuclease SbcCD ATPase subunit